MGGERASGAAHALRSLIANKDPGTRERRLQNVALAASETGAPLLSVARHARLFAPPSEDELWTCAREMWLDRVLFSAAAGVLVTAWALSQRHAFGVLASLGPGQLTTRLEQAGFEVTWAGSPGEQIQAMAVYRDPTGSSTVAHASLPISLPT